MIVFIVMAHLWISVCAIRCPFPGMTQYAQFANESVSWESRTSFQEGDVVSYYCPGFWAMEVPELHYSLTCQSSGLWDYPLPRCDHRLWDRSNDLKILSGRNSSQKWSKCIASDFYSVEILPAFKSLSYMELRFCNDTNDKLVVGTTLHNLCSNFTLRPTFHSSRCSNLSAQVVGKVIQIQSSKVIGLDMIIIHTNPGNQCGWPPVPDYADVTTTVIPGQTTSVSYKCRDSLILNGPLLSRCDQQTGQWTQIPKCVCPEPNVQPSNIAILHREDSLIRFKCEGVEYNITCDETGKWQQLRCDAHAGISSIVFIATSAVLALLLLAILIICIIVYKRLKSKRSDRQQVLARVRGAGLNELSCIELEHRATTRPTPPVPVNLNHVTAQSDDYLDPRTVQDPMYDELHFPHAKLKAVNMPNLRAATYDNVYGK